MAGGGGPRGGGGGRDEGGSGVQARRAHSMKARQKARLHPTTTARTALTHPVEARQVSAVTRTHLSMRTHSFTHIYKYTYSNKISIFLVTFYPSIRFSPYINLSILLAIYV